jgi:hypothetical protein
MKRSLIGGGAVLAGCLLLVPGTTVYFETGKGKRCASCHEMRDSYQQWQVSSHRGVACASCHGGAFTADVSFHLNNAKRAYAHLVEGPPEAIEFGNRHADAMNGRCMACHRQEYAAWKSGAHSATYARIFLDRKHNAANMLMDDCLRCHGMYFEKGIGDLVTPVNRNGPWRLAAAGLEQMPSIPCITCHELHREGQPLAKPNGHGGVPGRAQEVARPSLAFFDRRTRQYVPLAELPLPAMLERARAVKMSRDQRQALCYQCHAPVATMQVASGDDRTTLGVHEGISCLACHAQHGQKTRASCASCHPKMSNCKLDVEKMDTTFASPDSRHNIHWVKCADCHLKGVPRRSNRERQELAAE